jgi:RNase P/RNase MRP subunit p29
MEKIEKLEWIGLPVKIHYNEMVFHGKIIDETKNTLVIKTKEGEKKFLKNNSKIEFDKKIINGKKVTKRPEERIKK